MYTEFPQLRGKVVFAELGTPLSSEHYLGTPHSYGLAHTPARFQQDWLSVHTPISGLYLTGQDIVSCGVMGAMIGGFLTAMAIKPQIAWHNLRILTHL